MMYIAEIMGHTDAGHYAAKHPEGTPLNSGIAELVRQYSREGKITCANAHNIAEELKVSPAEVGITIDLLEFKISQCQLGLFGHRPQKRIVQPAKHVSPELQRAIEQARTDNRLACLSSWKIADQFGISKLDISAACEALQVKISPCQLGTF